jgi:hypothetical protein
MQLFGTGMPGEYLRVLDGALPENVLDEVLAAYERLPAGDDRESAADIIIFGDPKIGPVARNLIVLWYCGVWTVLPQAWREAYGMSGPDKNKVVSAQAYQSGLQWVVAGGHAAGAEQQGFGAWSLAPKEVVSREAAT